jgi:hypothetical protein
MNAWAKRIAGFFQLCVVLCLAAVPVAAQNLVEFRITDTKYRYLDWMYTFHNSLIVDVYYVGVPGNNEFNLGAGYGFKFGKLILSPLFYAVVGKEGGQRGVKAALLAVFEKEGWKINGYVAYFEPTLGSVSRYQALDTLDVTRSFAKRWELGISNGFCHTNSHWNPQIGPVLKLNDRLGAWSVSYRFGPQREFRAGRILTF